MEHQFKVIGENVVLRPVAAQDLEMLRNWRNKDNIRKSFINQNRIDKEQQKEWFRNYLSKTDDFMFIIEWNISDSQPIGTASLYNVNDLEGTAEFGRLMIGESIALGKGLAGEAVKLLCQFGFRKMQLKKIILQVLEKNNNAIQLYKKCGFQETHKEMINGINLINMYLKSEDS